MTKKRIPIEIKPCCRNCKLYGARECMSSLFDTTNPCQAWHPDKDWFGRKLKAAKKKQDKEAKAAKKPTPRFDDDEDEYLDVY